jgi:hypothetical protein
MKRLTKYIGLGAIAIIALFALIQLVPYGHSHTNPAVVKEPAWDSPATRALAVRACFDCHSNQTNWGWYTNVVPVSWLVQHDVEDGRGKLNFSTWNVPQRSANDMVETVHNNSMPPWFYVPIHPEAGLSSAERAQLIQGLQAIRIGGPGK